MTEHADTPAWQDAPAVRAKLADNDPHRADQVRHYLEIMALAVAADRAHLAALIEDLMRLGGARRLVPGVADEQPRFVEVHVSGLESEQLALPKPAVPREDDRGVAARVGRLGELLYLLTRRDGQVARRRFKDRHR